MVNKTLKTLYSLHGIPLEALDIRLEDVLPKTKAAQLRAKLKNTPKKGVLLVSGTALPIVNEIFSSKPVVGIDFVSYYQSQFSEEKTYVPKADRYYLYNIGKEPAKSTSYAIKLIEAFLALHKESFIILETSLSKTEFERQYQMSFVNYLAIKPKKEDKWV